MTRRAFLAALAAAIGYDPERRLWVPGRKLISIPPPVCLPAPRGNQFLTVEQISKMTLEVLERHLVFARMQREYNRLFTSVGEVIVARPQGLTIEGILRNAR
ncbi:MAG TPA: hypothetical protein VFA33_07660 [Bryobacteraceae bacterium]|nr:hypothetical protein [Bryobacteraceae bacterium]